MKKVSIFLAGTKKSSYHCAMNNTKNTEKMNNNNITIERLDYKNAAENGGFYSLPTLTNIEEIQDVNEVTTIAFSFSTREEADLFAAKFPKSYKGIVLNVWRLQSPSYFVLRFHFNTFFLNETTGSQNETAASRRLKVIKKIQSIK